MIISLETFRNKVKTKYHLAYMLCTVDAGIVLITKNENRIMPFPSGFSGWTQSFRKTNTTYLRQR